MMKLYFTEIHKTLDVIVPKDILSMIQKYVPYDITAYDENIETVFKDEMYVGIRIFFAHEYIDFLITKTRQCCEEFGYVVLSPTLEMVDLSDSYLVCDLEFNVNPLYPVKFEDGLIYTNEKKTKNAEETDIELMCTRILTDKGMFDLILYNFHHSFCDARHKCLIRSNSDHFQEQFFYL